MGSASLILVVDPDPDTCAMYAMGLAGTGWATEPVGDGREALAKAISHRPDVVVTETRLPGLNGLELCRLLKRDPDTCHIPILIMTSDAGEKQLDRAKEAGADKVLLKPFAPHELIAAIESTLAIRTEQRPGRFDAMRLPQPSTSPPRRTRSRLHARGETTTPPITPPELRCPGCDRRLEYQRSHIGGVNASLQEQWDEYECLAACGRFQYRQRTRKLRQLS